MHYHVIGGGWVDKTSSGETYVRISFGFPVKTDTTYTMVKNKKKNKPASPDYLISEFVSENNVTEHDVDGFLK